jgi:hypothetical protein
LRLRHVRDWRDFVAGRISGLPSKPADIPSSPELVYKDDWTGFSDFLGSARRRRSTDWVWRPFVEARSFARSLGLRGAVEWRAYARGGVAGLPPLPSDISSNPNGVYKDKGWISWGDWLGTGTIHGSLRNYRPFSEAREWVRGLGLRGWKDWTDFCAGRIAGMSRMPSDIPSNPNRTYKDEGWIDWGDWLGTGTVATHLQTYRPFTQARELVRGLGLKSSSEWRDYCAGRLAGKPPKPADIPAAPDCVYKDDGWAGVSDWLGTDRKPRKSRKARKPKIRKP